jgi:hypothetical protein
MAPAAPRAVTAVALWKSAEITWVAPVDDGGSAILHYVVTTPTGVTCSTSGMICRLTGLTPGQLLEVEVVAVNAVGTGPSAGLEGAKQFIPLSLNLWQLKKKSGQLVAKPMNQKQLATLTQMLFQDSGGFVIRVRIAANASGLKTAALKELLAREVKTIKEQLAKAGVLSKVQIRTQIISGNALAKRPSVVVVSTKP